MASTYCIDRSRYQRRKTRCVMVGDIGVGGENPIRIQSMTIADTMDTAATVAEVVQLAEAGCEIVRITAPSIKEAENLKTIKAALLERGVDVPLVADIHYTPNAAMIAAEHVEKVRINPGNYADKKRFEQREYSDAEYEQELLRIEARFKPLVLKCAELGRAMRIGTNHGSLSDRIMNRYGDTADGMVESALEFVRICRKCDYHEIILSMKSSNPLVAIQAYRLLAARLDELGWDYPFHLGVTEAGDGLEGRVKSAVGIGSLIEDGIGDTIRVSLTEDAVFEVPVAIRLAEKFDAQNSGKRHFDATGVSAVELRLPDPFEYQRRETLTTSMIYHKTGGSELPRVEASLRTPLSNPNACVSEIASLLGRTDSGGLALAGASNGKPAFNAEVAHVTINEPHALADLATLRNTLNERALFVPFAIHFDPGKVEPIGVAELGERLVVELNTGSEAKHLDRVLKAASRCGRAVEWKLKADNFHSLKQACDDALTACLNADWWDVTFSIAAEQKSFSVIPQYRLLAGYLDARGANFPILLRINADGDADRASLTAASQLGSLLCDGIGDSIHIDCALPSETLLSLSYNLLQATRLRISKTDYISCPSCGRTLFNLQTTTERIKSKTDHLKGVKIAIMGCIVNGPGEMADADFGYVGSGPKRVNLFVGKECVERNIPEEAADERLIELIKSHGMWVERV